jgi:hypothetical protein
LLLLGRRRRRKVVVVLVVTVHKVESDHPGGRLLLRIVAIVTVVRGAHLLFLIFHVCVCSQQEDQEKMQRERGPLDRSWSQRRPSKTSTLTTTERRS